MSSAPKSRKKTTTSAFGAPKREGHDSSPFYSRRLYSRANDLRIVTPTEIENPLPEHLKNTILHSSSEKMADLPDASVHLMVTSPPYNAAKEYDEDLSLEEYLTLLHAVFAETFRVLVPGGRACINIANLGRKPYIPLASFINDIMNDIGFLMRGEIIWNKAAGAGSSTAWGSWRKASSPTLRDVHEYILVFCKGTYTRNGKDRESTLSAENFTEWTKSVWSMPTERASRVGHPAPFPIELPHRLINLYTFTNDIVLDPFMGSGTTAIAAINSRRNFVGYETEKSYIQTALKRIKKEAKQ
ncbi:MAG: site-specific DNA-methyltransferase [Leptonema illini]|uniref:Methyltransferase n=1 Tax=Leptonema illini TaxID=183 RepID=A0A833H4S2_9LEPT|nr:MAG: site-specific DNA-methyltransferase [Leptonema illini]